MFGFGKKEKGESSGPVGEATLESGEVVSIAQCVDCIGDSCPRPQLMTKKALAAAAPGDVIEVLVDNPSSVEAIPPMLDGLGTTLLETRKSERRWELYLRKN
ncbi:MAG: sulfurtransferase TusA family protein [Gammaproteobacteria bacterium]|nr:sulfurtransferase TusA family protein [Gammaproteobacteria bacterium]